MLGPVIVLYEGSETQHTVEDIEADLSEEERMRIRSVEAQVDTTSSSLTFLSDLAPNITHLRLNNSSIAGVRDIGCSFSHLKYLSLSSCHLSSLSGISTLSKELEEIYLAFNQISDLCDLMSMEKLRILDLEDNLIETLDSISILSTCPRLKAITLIGNPITEIEDYRAKVSSVLPNLMYLDEQKLKSAKVRFQTAPTVSHRPIVTDVMQNTISERPPTVEITPEGARLPGLAPLQPLLGAKTQKRTLISSGKPKIFRPVSAALPKLR